MNAKANPHHPGETVRVECIEASGLTVTEAARRLGCSRPALSRVFNGRAAIAAEMALAPERQGWSNADFRMRGQAAYDLAQARRKVYCRGKLRPRPARAARMSSPSRSFGRGP